MTIGSAEVLAHLCIALFGVCRVFYNRPALEGLLYFVLFSSVNLSCPDQPLVTVRTMVQVFFGPFINIQFDVKKSHF